MNTKQKHISVATPIITLIILVIAINFSTTFAENLTSSDDNDWNIERIEETLGTEIPPNTMDFVYTGEWGRLTILELSFKASPATMTPFINHFCRGILYRNYDPFNAINVANPVSSSYAVELLTPWGSYHSYSLNAPITTFGNRCFRVKTEVFEIAIDQSNPDVYALHMKYVQSGGVPLPDIKLPNSPILFRGFRLREGEHRLEYNDFCIDIDPLEFRDDSERLSGKHINLSLGNQVLTSAFISETGLLIPVGTDVNQSEELSSNHFLYCHDTRNLQPGLHTLTIKIDDIQPYFWAFYKR